MASFLHIGNVTKSKCNENVESLETKALLTSEGGGHIFEKLNSLSFPRHFKIFPSATQEGKIDWNAISLVIVSHTFHFPFHI